ncbi:hypothetical protein KSS87_007820 [Heliosperma pusillum]|nr:hypothetical protein KSS87_007820 [Heliosperma pusillum]
MRGCAAGAQGQGKAITSKGDKGQANGDQMMSTNSQGGFYISIQWGIHWLPLSKLHLPKLRGGLGIKATSLLSQAFLLKAHWRIISYPTGILHKFIGPKYKKDLPIPLSKSKVSNPSYCWTGICRAVATASDGYVWKLGNGKSISCCTDYWINGKAPKLRSSMESHAFSFPALTLPDGNWNPFAVFRFFDPCCAKEILASEPPNPVSDDFLYWKYTEDGVYTLKSGYCRLLNGSLSNLNSRMDSFPWKIAWSQHISAKFPIFVWRLIREILPCLSSLSRRGFSIRDTCVLCHSHPETLEHLFRLCPISQHVWRSSQLGIVTTSNLATSFKQWISDFVVYLHRHQSPNFKSLLYFQCVLLAIWKTRNAVIFQGNSINPDSMLTLAEHLFDIHSQRSPYPSFQTTRFLTVYPNACGVSTQCGVRPIRIFAAIFKTSHENCFTFTSSATQEELSFSVAVRGSTEFAAYAKSLRVCMDMLQSANFTHVAFTVTSKKLSSVLASSLPVLIHLFHCLTEMRLLLRKQKFWSVIMVYFKELHNKNLTYLAIVDLENDDGNSGTHFVTRQSLRSSKGEASIVDKRCFHAEMSLKFDLAKPYLSALYLLKSNFKTKIDQHLSFPLLRRRIIAGSVKWDSNNLKIYGESKHIPGYWEWTEDVLARFDDTLEASSLSSAVSASLYSYDKNVHVMRAFFEGWCSTTNTLQTREGELSISLWDLKMLGGLSIVQQELGHRAGQNSTLGTGGRPRGIKG